MIPGTVEGAFHKGFYGWLTSPLSDAEVELTERVLEHQEGPEEARARGRQATRRMRSREGRATSRAAASREPPRARGFSRAAAASQRKRLNAEARVWEELARQRESWLCPRCAFRKTLGRDGGPIINLPTRKTCFKCSYPQDGYTVLSDGSRVYVDPEAATAKELRKAGGGAVPDEGMGDPGPADPEGIVDLEVDEQGEESEVGQRAGSPGSGSRRRRGGKKLRRQGGPRKGVPRCARFDPRRADRNNPFAHDSEVADFGPADLCCSRECVVCPMLGIGAYFTYRSYLLVRYSFDAVEIQLEAVSVAAVGVTRDVGRAGGALVWVAFWCATAATLLACVWYANKKVRLRLSGMEPEANIPVDLGPRERYNQELSAFRGNQGHIPGNALLVRILLTPATGEQELHAAVTDASGEFGVVIRLPPGKSPLVNWKSNQVYCPCRDFFIKGQGCRHARAVFVELMKDQCRWPDLEHLSGSIMQSRAGILAAAVPLRSLQAAVATGYDPGAPAGSSGSPLPVAVRRARSRMPEVRTPGLQSKHLGCLEGLWSATTRERINKATLTMRNQCALDTGFRDYRFDAPSATLPAGANSNISAESRVAGLEVPRAVTAVAECQTDLSVGPSLPAGVVAKFLSGAESQRELVFLLRSRGAEVQRVYLLGFSFDAQEVTTAITELAGVPRLIVLDRDQTLSGTKLQVTRAKQLQAGGAEVRITSGSPVKESYEARSRTVSVAAHVKGKLHAKAVFVQIAGVDYFILGSANWSDSTTANIEVGALLVNPGAGFSEAWLLEWRKVWAVACPLSEAEEDQHRREVRSPSRARASHSHASEQ